MWAVALWLKAAVLVIELQGMEVNLFRSDNYNCIFNTLAQAVPHVATLK